MRIRKLTSLLVPAILLTVAGCSSPADSSPVATVSTPTSTHTLTPTQSPTATRTPTPTHSPTVQVTPTKMASPEPTTEAQGRLLTEVTPRIHGTYPSPDGNWEVQVVIYDCTDVDPEAPGGNALEQLVLVSLADSTQTVLDSQFIYCGGLGASGLEGRFWTSDSQFFFYTSAREGVPDGCGFFWARPLLRVNITDPQPKRFGSSAISPDGNMIAAWISGQLEIWETAGGQIAAAEIPISVASNGPIAWSPDNRSVAYLLTEEPCLTGVTYVVTVALADMEPVLVLTSEDPSFSDLAWDDLNALTLSDREGTAWSFDLTTGQLTGPNN